MIPEPFYDGDYVTLGYLNNKIGQLSTELKGTNQLLLSKSQNFGTQPNPPYRKYDTYMSDDGIYICVNERLIGTFNPADWTKASTFVNVEDAIHTGITTDGTLMASNGGTNVAGLTGVSSGDSATRLWAGSTFANRDSAPFRVTQGGFLYASNANIQGTITATSGSFNGTITTNNITANGGTIGGWNISNVQLQKLTGQYSFEIRTDRGASEPAFLVYDTSNSRYNFYVRPDGYLYARNAQISGTITSSTVSGSTINGSYISGGRININDRFKVLDTGKIEVVSDVGFFTIGGNLMHPWMSTVQLAATQTGGLIFMTGQTIDNIGNIVSYIDSNTSGMLRVRGSGSVEINNGYGGNVRIKNVIVKGTDIDSATGAIGINAIGGSSVWASGNNLASSRVLTSAGAASSKILKENIKKFEKNDFDEAYRLLKKINIYEYDYKYNLYTEKHQYGFIIDDFENEDEAKKFFRFNEMKADITDGKFDPKVTDDNTLDKDNLRDNIITYKEYDTNVLDKYLLTCLKSLQQKIEELEEEIEKIKGGK